MKFLAEKPSKGLAAVKWKSVPFLEAEISQNAIVSFPLGLLADSAEKRRIYTSLLLLCGVVSTKNIAPT
jgi:hypothetical protein